MGNYSCTVCSQGYTRLVRVQKMKLTGSEPPSHCWRLSGKVSDVYVSGTHIGDEIDEDFALPQEAKDFIHRFNARADIPEERMGLPEFTFEGALREEIVIAN